MAMTPERRKRRMTAKEGAAMLGKSERSVQRLVAQERGEWIEEQRQRRLAMLEMYEADEDVIYYLTLQNENYVMPPMPDPTRQPARFGSSLAITRPESAMADLAAATA